MGRSLYLCTMAIEEEDICSSLSWRNMKHLKGAETARLSTLLNGEYDGNNAILSFTQARGNGSSDWAQMLYRCIHAGLSGTASNAAFGLEGR